MSVVKVRATVVILVKQNIVAETPVVVPNRFARGSLGELLQSFDFFLFR